MDLLLGTIGTLGTAATAVLGILLYKSGRSTQAEMKGRLVAEATLSRTQEANQELINDLARMRGALRVSEKALVQAHKKLAERGDAADIAADIRELLGRMQEMPAVPTHISRDHEIQVHGPSHEGHAGGSARELP